MKALNLSAKETDAVISRSLSKAETDAVFTTSLTHRPTTKAALVAASPRRAAAAVRKPARKGKR